MAATTVLGYAELLSCICAFQNGLSSAIVAIQRCQLIHTIHGDLISSQQASSESDGIHAHMNDLAAIMDRRRCLVEAAMDHPANSALLFRLVAKHTHTRDVVVEYAVFFGQLHLFEAICLAMKRAVSNDPQHAPRFDVFDRMVIPSHAYLLRHLAAFHGHLDVLVCLNTTSYSSLRGRGGTERSYSDIEVAAERGHAAVVAYLVDSTVKLFDATDHRGHKVFARDYFGLRPPSTTTKTKMFFRGIERRSVADAAADAGHETIAACLIQHGAPHTTRRTGRGWWHALVGSAKPPSANPSIGQTS
ncbi:Aste57867_13997 [Aphanomyces stellatus]|uniref:Aste57867_13997 protein n=1 Tax=Aphanomyces stellatus TaxID=120398 RepID=A0A485KZW4_9STRA|nr:hypothetical protein As57867_013946 [Aphanomyces stellatus]VFT90827.1 Aste57867_13997 [Aphanomyces stellatus]